MTTKGTKATVQIKMIAQRAKSAKKLASKPTSDQVEVVVFVVAVEDFFEALELLLELRLVLLLELLPELLPELLEPKL